MPLPDDEQIVAVGLLTQHDLNLLGHSFTRVWAVDETPCFEGLLEAIDEAEKKLKESRVTRSETSP